MPHKHFQAESIIEQDLDKLSGIYFDMPDTSVRNLYSKPGISRNTNLTIINQLFVNIPKATYYDKQHNIIDPLEKYIRIKFNSNTAACITVYHNI